MPLVSGGFDGFDGGVSQSIPCPLLALLFRFKELLVAI